MGLPRKPTGLDFTVLMQAVQIQSLVGKPRIWPQVFWTLQPKSQNIKQKQYCNKFNKDFKNGPHLKKKNLSKKMKEWSLRGRKKERLNFHGSMNLCNF